MPERLPRCGLRGYRIECRGALQRHHIITKQMARGNKAVRDLLRKCPDELMAWVCEAHHIGRYVENPQARARLLARNVELYGYERVQVVVDGLAWKTAKPEWALWNLLSPFAGWEYLGQPDGEFHAAQLHTGDEPGSVVIDATARDACDPGV